jgi:hypothetical protein
VDKNGAIYATAGKIGNMAIGDLVHNAVGKNLLQKANYSSTSTFTSNSKSGYGFYHAGGVGSTVSAVEIGRISNLSLKAKTTYTVSFVAWINTTDSSFKQLLECDFHPDTLPQKSDIYVTSKPERFSWTTSSEHADMGNCVLRFFSD